MEISMTHVPEYQQFMAAYEVSKDAHADQETKALLVKEKECYDASMKAIGKYLEYVTANPHVVQDNKRIEISLVQESSIILVDELRGRYEGAIDKIVKSLESRGYTVDVVSRLDMFRKHVQVWIWLDPELRPREKRTLWQKIRGKKSNFKQYTIKGQ